MLSKISDSVMVLLWLWSAPKKDTKNRRNRFRRLNVDELENSREEECIKSYRLSLHTVMIEWRARWLTDPLFPPTTNVIQHTRIRTVFLQNNG